MVHLSKASFSCASPSHLGLKGNHKENLRALFLSFVLVRGGSSHFSGHIPTGELAVVNFS